MNIQEHKNNSSFIQKERNYGIDLLRLTAGFYVLILHTLGQGGVLENVPEGSLSFKILWFFEILAYCTVDIFILISGYTSFSSKKDKNFRQKLILLWLEVLFYSIFEFIIIKIIQHDKILSKDLLSMFFPVLIHKDYWFFASYFGLFLIKPILDKGIEYADEAYLKAFFFVIITFFCFYTIIRDPFFLSTGYSPFWFIILYILGAICKKCKIWEKTSAVIISISLIVLLLITWTDKCFGPTFYIFNERIHDKSLISYTSPTILCIAILHLLLFARLKLSDVLTKCIKFASPSVFAIYLMNTHPVYWNTILRNKFASIANRRISVLFPQLFLYICSFYVFAILVDKVRQYLFKSVQTRINDQILKK